MPLLFFVIEVDIDKIMDICMVLDVTPEQLLTGKGIDRDLEALEKMS